jgi:predicted naringenin-chalcone synthase
MTDVREPPVRTSTAPVKKGASSSRPDAGVALLGIGTATPPGVNQTDAVAIAQGFACETEIQRAWLKRVFLRSDVRERGTVLQQPGASDFESVRAFYPPAAIAGDRGPATSVRMERYAREAPPLAERAASEALRTAAVAPASITHLITVSCTGFIAPGLDYEMITRLGLRPTVRRTHIGFMGCHAAFNAMASAREALGADPDARVLIVCVELSTLHFAYGWNPERLVANALFADGSSACVVGRPSSIPAPAPTAGAPDSPAGKAAWRLLETASLLLPDSREAMTWRIGDHGFEMSLSAELPALIANHIRPWCDAWLGELGLGVADIDHWAIHPGGPRILSSAANALGIPLAATAISQQTLADHGNMSSATLLFLLRQLASQAGPEPAYCVAIGFGPGLMAEGLLLEI